MSATRLHRIVLCFFLVLVSIPGLRAEATASDVAAFVRDYYAAYGAKDTVRLTEFYTPEATFEDPTFELALKGPRQIKDLLDIALAKYESLNWEIAHTLVAGDDLVVEGTMVGQLRGKGARVRFVSVFHFTEGRISTQRDLFDVLHFYTQLGVVPPQFRPKPAAAAAPAAPKGG